MIRTKLVSGIIAIFAAGVVCGGLAVQIHSEAFRHECRMPPPHHEDSIVRHITKELDLDSLQQRQVRAIVYQTKEKIDCAQCQTRSIADAAIDDSHKKIEALLRPDQKDRFKKMMAAQKARHPAHLPMTPFAHRPAD